MYGWNSPFARVEPMRTNQRRHADRDACADAGRLVAPLVVARPLCGDRKRRRCVLPRQQPAVSKARSLGQRVVVAPRRRAEPFGLNTCRCLGLVRVAARVAVVVPVDADAGTDQPAMRIAGERPAVGVAEAGRRAGVPARIGRRDAGAPVAWRRWHRPLRRRRTWLRPPRCRPGRSRPTRRARRTAGRRTARARWGGSRGRARQSSPVGAGEPAGAAARRSRAAPRAGGRSPDGARRRSPAVPSSAPGSGGCPAR